MNNKTITTYIIAPKGPKDKNPRTDFMQLEPTFEQGDYTTPHQYAKNDKFSNKNEPWYQKSFGSVGTHFQNTHEVY